LQDEKAARDLQYRQIRQGSQKFPLTMGTGSLTLWIFSLMAERPFAGVFRLMDLSAATEDSGYLFAAAALLVLLNTTRALFLYLGWFFIGDGIARTTGKSGAALAVPAVAIPLCYQLLAMIESTAAPHFGIPAVMGILTVLAIQILTKDVAGWVNKALALALLLFSFQWLDVIPTLTIYGFGWGEVSMAVKDLAILLGRDRILDLLGTVTFAMVFAGGLVTSELLILSARQLQQLRRIRVQERQLSRLREEHLRTRSSREMQNLVHDLKRPLTSITGLADVIEGSAASGTLRRHAGVIQQAAWGMNQIISEILSSSSRRTIETEEIISYTMSQVSSLEFHRRIDVILPPECASVILEVNLVRLSRALVNILDNAARASEFSFDPRILLEVGCNGGRVTFTVTDNGRGFSGTGSGDFPSGWGSTGLGLAFSEEVVREHGGSLEIGNSEKGGGRVRIVLPAKEEARQ
jgi:signal transduction histidine kinase